MIPLPAYIDPEAWAGFEESRRKLRAPLTDRARTLILYELQRIKDAGHDPNAALDQSTMKGWRDVWPAREKEICLSASGAAEARKRAQEAETAAIQASIDRAGLNRVATLVGGALKRA